MQQREIRSEERIGPVVSPGVVAFPREAGGPAPPAQRSVANLSQNFSSFLVPISTPRFGTLSNSVENAFPDGAGGGKDCPNRGHGRHDFVSPIGGNSHVAVLMDKKCRLPYFKPLDSYLRAAYIP